MTTPKKAPTSYGPIQFPTHTGLHIWQFERAQRLGLIPQPDVEGYRWSAAVFDQALACIDDIRAAVGTLPDVGAIRAEEYLAERFPTVPIHPGTATELARRGHLPIRGRHREHVLFCGLTLERLDGRDRMKVARASAAGQLHMRDTAAEILGIRESDFGHLVRTGLITHVDTAESGWGDEVLLYRQGDLDRLARSSRIDWDAVRSTPKGKRSPLAALPTRKDRP